MGVHVLLNLLNVFVKRDKMRGFFTTSLINSLIQEHEYRFDLLYYVKIILKSYFWRKSIISNVSRNL